MAESSPENVENDDALDLWQIDSIAVNFEDDRVPKVPTQALVHHFTNAHLQVVFLVVQATVEFVGILLASRMKVQANVGVDANAEIVVHHINLRIVLVRVGLANVDRYRQLSLHVVDLFVLFRMEHDGPAIERDLFGVDNVLEQVDRFFSSSVASAPSQDARQIVSCAQRNNGHGRRLAFGILTNIVKTRQDPADRSVASASQYSIRLDIAKHVESKNERDHKLGVLT